jgi:hypothetical protein
MDVDALIASLRAAEGVYVSRREYAVCQSINEESASLQALAESSKDVENKINAAVSARNYGEAEQLQKEFEAVQAAVKEKMGSIREDFAEHLKVGASAAPKVRSSCAGKGGCTSSTAGSSAGPHDVPQGTPVMGQAVGQAVAPQQWNSNPQAYHPSSVNYPVHGAGGAQSSQGMDAPLLGGMQPANHQVDPNIQRFHSTLQPYAAQPAGGVGGMVPYANPYANPVPVPPGAPPGGHYKMDKYCGPVTWCIGCFICCCVCCCPCDEREVYVAPNGNKYSRTGALVTNDC